MTETTPVAPSAAPVSQPTTTAPSAAPARDTLHLNQKPAPTSAVPEPIKEIMTSQAYREPTHEDHKSANEKVVELLKAQQNQESGSVEGSDEGPENLIDAASKKLAGKYDTPEELEKAYVELQKKMRSGEGKVPETYELDRHLKEAGFDVYDPTEYAEVYKAYDQRFKKAGVTSEQIPELVSIFKAEMETVQQALAREYGPVPNIPQERTKLETKWGDQTTARLNELGKYAQANIPPTVYKVLGRTAEGAEWLYEVMSKGYGPVPIQSGPTSAPDPLTIGKQIKELITSPAYSNVHHQDNKAVTERVRTLLKQQSSQR